MLGEEDAWLELAVIESSPPMPMIRLGLPGRDEEIEWFNTMLRNMGALAIPVVCYNFMGYFGWIAKYCSCRLVYSLHFRTDFSEIRG